MAYSTLVLSKEMIISVTLFRILLHLLIVQGIHGHLGCEGDLVPCLNTTHCIKIEQICIDYHDCVNDKGQKICHYCPLDRNDSIACVTSLESHIEFECLSINEICDGKKDCINNEDEHLCGVQKCKHDDWLCNNGTCIEKNRRCDGRIDCTDGSDEDESCHRNPCGLEQIRCPTGVCIEKTKICDGFSHCSDGYDEKNCPHITSITIQDSCLIPSNTFTCSSSTNSICISKDRICDGYVDCPMGDDEFDCNNKCILKSKCVENPDTICIEHPSEDQLCRCIKRGYRLITDLSQKTNQLCQDFNECNDSLGTYCSFNCINTDGSFNCTCPLGSVLDKQTKICRKIIDQTKVNLLILFDDYINLYNIINNTTRYTLKSLNKINIEKTHHFNHIQYDPNQMFIIYYDQNQHAIFCQSSLTSKPLILLSNLTIDAFAYNANENLLFLIENQSKTLRIYAPITCSISYQIKMHSWSLNNITDRIQSMDIDISNRQIIFSTRYEFLISNLTEPNVTKVVYSTNQEIKTFIYDISFKRIFWTTVNKTNKKIFSVYTCNDDFKQCQDTSIVLPSAWPFAFFNDGLIYSSLSLKSLDFIQLYGKDRFSNHFLTSTKENIHSFIYIDYQPIDSLNLCLKNSSKILCENKLCLQINSTNINCLSIDENILSNDLILFDNINFDLQNNIQSLKLENFPTVQRKNYLYRSSNIKLFCIITLGILVTFLAFFVKFCHNRLNQQTLNREQRQHEQYLTTDEPNLDEFNVMVDDRVSKQRVDYARKILFQTSTILLIGRRRDSI